MIRKTAILLLSVTILFAVASCSEDSSTSSSDKEAPTVEVKTPWDGTKRSGVVEVSVESADEYGVSRVEFYVNGAKVSTDTTVPYSYEWDMTSLAVGSENTLYAKAADAKGNSAKSETVTVTHEETAAPVATLVGPGDNSTFAQGDVIAFIGSATDVEDGSLTDSQISWSSNLQGDLGASASFDYRGLVIGTHVISMIATDSNGIQDVETLTVNVSENSLNYATIEAGYYKTSAPVFQSTQIHLSKAYYIYKTEISIAEWIEILELWQGELGKKKGWLYWCSERNDELYEYGTGTKVDVGLYPNGRIYESNWEYSAKGSFYEGTGDFTPTYGNYPVCFITYLEAVQCLNAMSVRDGLTPVFTFLDTKGEITSDARKIRTIFVETTSNGWRFPTETEWEVAARAGLTDSKFPWGDTGPGGLCNSMSDQLPPSPVDFYNGRGIVPVDSYEPNRYGLYNTVGNVAELTLDLFIGVPPSGEERYDRWDVEDIDRFLCKGGAWYEFGAHQQIGMRNITVPMNTKDKDAMGSGVGFRPVRSAD